MGIVKTARLVKEAATSVQPIFGVAPTIFMVGRGPEGGGAIKPDRTLDETEVQRQIYTAKWWGARYIRPFFWAAKERDLAAAPFMLTDSGKPDLYAYDNEHFGENLIKVMKWSCDGIALDWYEDMLFDRCAKKNEFDPWNYNVNGVSWWASMDRKTTEMRRRYIRWRVNKLLPYFKKGYRIIWGINEPGPEEMPAVIDALELLREMGIPHTAINPGAQFKAEKDLKSNDPYYFLQKAYRKKKYNEAQATGDEKTMAEMESLRINIPRVIHQIGNTKHLDEFMKDPQYFARQCMWILDRDGEVDKVKDNKGNTIRLRPNELDNYNLMRPVFEKVKNGAKRYKVIVGQSVFGAIVMWDNNFDCRALDGFSLAWYDEMGYWPKNYEKNKFKKWVDMPYFPEGEPELQPKPEPVEPEQPGEEAKKSEKKEEQKMTIKNVSNFMWTWIKKFFVDLFKQWRVLYLIIGMLIGAILW
jgi:hypothetical protein